MKFLRDLITGHSNDVLILLTNFTLLLSNNFILCLQHAQTDQKADIVTYRTQTKSKTPIQLTKSEVELSVTF